MAPRNVYTGEGGSSVISTDLSHGNVESGESLQPVQPTADVPPEEIPHPEFFGIDTSYPHRCHHKMCPARKVAFVYTATGRRFLGCPLSGPDRCSWFMWIDEAWGPVLSRSLIQLWDQALLDSGRAARLQTKKKVMEQAYLELWTERSNMEIENQQVVNKLKTTILDTEIKMSRRMFSEVAYVLRGKRFILFPNQAARHAVEDIELIAATVGDQFGPDSEDSRVQGQLG
ncbi:unnamed protein product [Triticum turgidum subsp. durum]|uniref:GRF-type domain-containing protein n=1 Tax=Triticum turgidum subsp. durum TaxID=4567 RepID=A0A9R0ZF19_TRITD|nr:unnamed protein product [Triticum turgidum subsp. durum]